MLEVTMARKTETGTTEMTMASGTVSVSLCTCAKNQMYIAIPFITCSHIFLGNDNTGDMNGTNNGNDNEGNTNGTDNGNKNEGNNNGKDNGNNNVGSKNGNKNGNNNKGDGNGTG